MRNAPSIPLRAGILLTGALVCALISNALAGGSRRLAWMAIPTEPAPNLVISPVPGATPQPKPVDPANLDRFAADPEKPIRELLPEDAWLLFQNNVLFLDARRSSEFGAGHVSGAWNISVWESSADSQTTEFEATAKPSFKTPMVLYCNGGDCEDSQLLASKLATLGYRNLFIYRAGYPDWVKQGRSITKGVKP